MQCELFLRDQPELCLLMGDERRDDRIKVAKMIYKAATEKKASEDAAVSSSVHSEKTDKKTAEDAAALSFINASSRIWKRTSCSRHGDVNSVCQVYLPCLKDCWIMLFRLMPMLLPI